MTAAATAPARSPAPSPIDRLTVIDGAARPAGWSGKLWAVAQGVAGVEPASSVLLTDADIVHDPAHRRDAGRARPSADGLDLVSEMVALNCESAAERALVPAFVFFFQLLYPFARVNDPRSAHRRGGRRHGPDPRGARSPASAASRRCAAR